ncbi:transposase [Cupriavidus sp. AcVe19-1a]|uniref:transposase n=2 Tax=unclassified Cupriavidus TaxID=2640874 RepID=UPI001AE51522|nr:transposase [Cupriavidus sp. AcVe19-1a]MBP0633639.1 transposase [Cupriavidus sp. AcVe19-1a]
MEIKARGRRRGSKNYTKAFRTQVVADTRDPTRSLAEVARAHGLNANLVSKRRRDQERAAASASEPAELFLPIEMASGPMPAPIGSSGLVIECRGVRVCFEGKPEPDVLQLVLASLLGVGS